MFDDGDTDSPYPMLACGHVWDGQEPWAEMAVILKDWIDDPEGAQPVVGTGHYCRTCRGLLSGERLGSMDEAWAWLERERSRST